MEPRKKKKKNTELVLATRLEHASENEMKLGLAYEKLKERVAKGIQADEMVTHILKELKVLDKNFREFKQKRRQQKLEKERSRKRLQKTRECIFNLRKQFQREKEADHKKLEKIKKEKKRLVKRSQFVGSQQGKMSSKYDLSRLAPHLVICGELLRKYYNLPHAAIFIHPVDEIQYPDYRKIVRQPICYHNIREQLFRGIYQTVSNFAQDLLMVWRNAKIYNPSHNQVHLWALEFEHAFQRDMETHKITTMSSTIMQPSPQKQQQQQPSPTLNPEELNLIECYFLKLPEKKLNSLIDLIFQENTSSDEVSIDIENLSIEIQHKILDEIKSHFSETIAKSSSSASSSQQQQQQKKNIHPTTTYDDVEQHNNTGSSAKNANTSSNPMNENSSAIEINNDINKNNIPVVASSSVNTTYQKQNLPSTSSTSQDLIKNLNIHGHDDEEDDEEDSNHLLSTIPSLPPPMKKKRRNFIPEDDDEDEPVANFGKMQKLQDRSSSKNNYSSQHVGKQEKVEAVGKWKEETENIHHHEKEKAQLSIMDQVSEKTRKNMSMVETGVIQEESSTSSSSLNSFDLFGPEPNETSSPLQNNNLDCNNKQDIVNNNIQKLKNVIPKPQKKKQKIPFLQEEKSISSSSLIEASLPPPPSLSHQTEQQQQQQTEEYIADTLPNDEFVDDSIQKIIVKPEKDKTLLKSKWEITTKEGDQQKQEHQEFWSNFNNDGKKNEKTSGKIEIESQAKEAKKDFTLIQPKVNQHEQKDLMAELDSLLDF